MDLFVLYLGTTSAESFGVMPQEEVELLPGVWLLPAVKFEEDVHKVLSKLAKIFAHDK